MGAAGRRRRQQGHPLSSPTSPRAHRSTRFALRLAAVALVALAGLVGAGNANAAPCWKVLINDWYDGRIDKVYPARCYGEAIKRLPRDVKDYASAEEDINRALQQRLVSPRRTGTREGDKTRTIPTGNDSGGGGTNGDGTDGGGGGTTGGPEPPTETRAEPPTETTAGDEVPGRDESGGILDTFGPSNADAVPLPLLILAGVALLLLAAAAVSFVTRRLQKRRLPGGPPGPPEPPLQ